MELTFKVSKIAQGYPFATEPNQTALILFNKDDSRVDGTLTLKLEKTDPHLSALIDAWRLNQSVRVDISIIEDNQ